MKFVAGCGLKVSRWLSTKQEHKIQLTCADSVCLFVCVRVCVCVQRRDCRMWRTGQVQCPLSTDDRRELCACNSLVFVNYCGAHKSPDT